MIEPATPSQLYSIGPVPPSQQLQANLGNSQTGSQLDPSVKLDPLNDLLV